MKKLVLMAAAIVAVSFASCGNKAANADQVAVVDTVTVAEEVAVETVAEVADTAKVDSAAVVAE